MDTDAPALTDDPRNRGVLDYLAARAPGSAVLQRPEATLTPYLGSGSHPDIVERVWKGLSTALPEDCRAMVHGTPALVHPVSGLVLAVAIGTQYAVRLRAADLPAATARGAKTSTRWSGGGTFDVREALGADWILGGWMPEEPTWVGACFLEESPGR